MDICKINQELLHFLPFEIDCIIIEFLLNSVHNFQPMYIFSNLCEYISACCIYKNKMYTFSSQSLILISISNTEEHNIVNSTHNMCGYKNYIYVLFEKDIYVFDEQCNKTKQISLDSDSYYYINKHGNTSTMMKIAADNIFLVETNSSIVEIINMIDHKTNKIELSSRIFTMKVCDDNLYILTHSEKIYNCMPDGKITLVYNFRSINKSIQLIDFCIIDGRIYVSQSATGYIYVLKNHVLVKKIHMNNFSKRITCHNNMLYINTHTCVYAYNIEKRNMVKIIMNKLKS